jgi:sortase A
MKFIKSAVVTTLLAVFFIQLAVGLYKIQNDIWDPLAEKSAKTNRVNAFSAEQSVFLATGISENSSVVALEVEPKQKPLPEIQNSHYSYLLQIPKMGINNSPILGMGLTSEGKMDVPDNYHEVGWYKLGAKPGEIGNAVLGAHVDDGYNTPGLFKNLKNLQVGDDIFIIGDNGEKLHYKVTGSKIYRHDLVDTREVFIGKEKSRIKLITCHGNFMPSLNTYDERLVVSAELV